MCKTGGPRCAKHTRMSYQRALSRTIEAAQAQADYTGDDPKVLASLKDAVDQSIRKTRIAQAAHDSTPAGLKDLAPLAARGDEGARRRFAAGYAERLTAYQRHDVEAGRPARESLDLMIDGHRWNPDGTVQAPDAPPVLPPRPRGFYPTLKAKAVTADEVQPGDYIYTENTDAGDGATILRVVQVDKATDGTVTFQGEQVAPRRASGTVGMFAPAKRRLQRLTPPTSAGDLLHGNRGPLGCSDDHLSTLQAQWRAAPKGSGEREYLAGEISRRRTLRLRAAARFTVPRATHLLITEDPDGGPHVHLAGYTTTTGDTRPIPDRSRDLLGTEAADIYYNDAGWRHGAARDTRTGGWLIPVDSSDAEHLGGPQR